VYKYVIRLALSCILV